MKKKLIILLMLVLAFCITGCNSKSDSSSDAVNNSTDNQPEQKDEGQNSQLINPLRETTKDEMVAETGIIVDAPYGIEDARYFVLTVDDKKTAQIEFKVGEYELTYRAETTDLSESYDTTGLYYTWDEEKEVEVGHCKANLMVCDEAKGIYWLDTEPEINYSLSCVSDIDEGQFVGLANLCYAAINDTENK